MESSQSHSVTVGQRVGYHDNECGNAESPWSEGSKRGRVEGLAHPSSAPGRGGGPLKLPQGQTE